MKTTIDTHSFLCDPIFDPDRTEVIETLFENTCRLYGMAIWIYCERSKSELFYYVFFTTKLTKNTKKL